MKYHGESLVEYILTLRRHNNDALDLNEELTGLVASHETIQNDLETVKADLAGSRTRAKKLQEELATTKKELADAQQQLKTAQAQRDESPVGSKSSVHAEHHHAKAKWPDAPILTNGENPTFEAWAQKVVQKTDRSYPDRQDQIDYACSRVGGQAEAFLAPRVRVGTPMPFTSRDEVLDFLHEIMADPNPRQTDKRFPQQQLSSSRYGTAKATTGASPKPVANTTPAAGATVTVRPRTYNTARLSEADIARYQKEGRCSSAVRKAI
ncbi:MAG: hypothetical protein Q9188_006203 [Gyalolechia gomerana]